MLSVNQYEIKKNTRTNKTILMAYLRHFLSDEKISIDLIFKSEIIYNKDGQKKGGKKEKKKRKGKKKRKCTIGKKHK